MTIPVTKEGKEKLQQQLHELTVRVPVVRKQIAEAREKGDLRENAEYHAAREELGLLEAKIVDVKTRLANCTIVDSSQIDQSRIAFGAIVTLLDPSDQSEEEWELVGQGEDDPLDNRILTSSPMGEALLGHQVGDEVEFTAPVGILRFKITALRYEN